MRKKRLIIGLFTAALVAAAVPVASATTSTASAKGGCYTYQYLVTPGTAYLYYSDIVAGRAPRHVSNYGLLNVKKPDFHGSLAVGNLYNKGNKSRIATGVYMKYAGRGTTIHYLRCW